MPRLWMFSIVLSMRPNQYSIPLPIDKGNLVITSSYLGGHLSSKEFKISLLTHKYEAFDMEEGETINMMYNRFNDIIMVSRVLWR